MDKLLEYPIKIAKDGFKLTQPTKDYFIHSLEPLFMWHEYSKDVLNNVYKDLDNGIVKLDKLSDTYSYISSVGFNDFYNGDISKSILQTVEQEGGHATAGDFNNYDLIEDSKFNYQFNDLKLTGHAGPSIGGLMVLKYLETQLRFGLYLRKLNLLILQYLQHKNLNSIHLVHLNLLLQKMCLGRFQCW